MPMIGLAAFRVRSALVRRESGKAAQALAISGKRRVQSQAATRAQDAGRASRSVPACGSR